MGLLSFLTRTNTSKLQPVSDGLLKTEPDLRKSHLLKELLALPIESRDDQWLRSVYQNTPTAAFECASPRITMNGQGFSLFALKIPLSGTRADLHCIQNLKDEFLLADGLGISITDEKNKTQWELSYGDLVNLHLNNEFVTPTDPLDVVYIDMTKRVQVLKKGEEVMMAQPSERYFPERARNTVRRFLGNAGVKSPMIMLLCRKQNGRHLQQLAFNIPLNPYSVRVHDELMKAITWFLPRHYSIISFSSDCDMIKYFEKL